ncbi:MAG: hypothetical protein L0Y48_03970 [Fusobacteria bacterium]|nr:hypothetical protein [Fusobacteriota bacterium]
MMIKAIVYTSNTGLTKEYAQILGTELKLPVYELKEVKNILSKGDQIAYLSWLMAGGLKGYGKAQRKYQIVTVCAVGMSRARTKQEEEIKKKYQLGEQFFYLQGGYDRTKLKGIYKLMMNTLEKALKPQLEAKENKNEEDLEMLEMMNSGKNCVRKENLDQVISYLKSRP